MVKPALNYWEVKEGLCIICGPWFSFKIMLKTMGLSYNSNFSICQMDDFWKVNVPKL